MRKKIYTLNSCSTCQRIIKELGIGEEFEYQNIKESAISPEQVDEMAKMSGSYESLFSRKAMKYRQWKLNEKELSEKDYRQYITEEYTFLKRPVFIIGDEIFVGNSKKNIESVAQKLAE